MTFYIVEFRPHSCDEPYGEEALYKYPVGFGAEQSREWNIQPTFEYSRTAQMFKNCAKGLKSRIL